jgi:saccharopine dehydrogenase-like NADP-dependent oxidoreductase
MVGSAMAVDLVRSEGFDVTVADVRPAPDSARAAGVGWIQADLSDASRIEHLAAAHDVVLGALSSTLGMIALRAVIEAGKPYCDISFMAEDALELGDLARDRGVTAIVDCGVAPGMSNMIAGYATSCLVPCESLRIYVGGLPAVRLWPYEYKVPFSPYDLIEEYTRPARLVVDGRIVVKEALSEAELIDFPEVGTLEAFNTDGLRSLVRTLKVPNMLEKTMRYPGHIALMRLLRETGLFSKEPIEVAGQTVRPLDLTSALLFPKLAYAEGEADLTVMRLIAEGRLDGRHVRMTWDLVDRYDAEAGLRSMSRTTGFAATIVAAMLARGEFARPGVHAPEVLGAEPGLLDRVFAAHARRGVHYRSSMESFKTV